MKVSIIGAGNVGAATAYALIMRGVARKIVLIDINKKRAQAEALDILHATPFAYANKIKAGEYKDMKDSDVVIITAGANQKPGESRLDLIEKNTLIFENIVKSIVKYAPYSIILVASNPVDVMTRVTLRLSGLPAERVIGSGTILDTARFRTLLGYHLGISAKSVHSYVLGEHGDSEVLAWSSADAAGIPVLDYARNQDKEIDEDIKGIIDNNVRNAAYKIIEGKGSTYYGIGGGLTRICQAISSNEYAILTISSFHKDVYGVKNVYLSLPTVVGKRGVHNVIQPNLNNQEIKELINSAKILQEAQNQALKFI